MSSTTLQDLMTGNYPGAPQRPAPEPAPPSAARAAPAVVFERWGDGSSDAGRQPDPSQGSAAAGGIGADPIGGASPSFTFERWGDGEPAAGPGILDTISKHVDIPDIAKSGATGVAKGAVQIAGGGGDTWSIIDSGLAKAGLPDAVRGVVKNVFSTVYPIAHLPTSSTISKAIQDQFGEFYEPQTRGGRYAETIGEFLPGAVPGPFNGVRQLAGNVIKYAALPGAASEAAGEATKGTGLEPYARAGAAVVTAGGAGLVTRPRTSQQVIRREMPAQIDDAVMDRAQALVADARQRGIALTWPEAIEQVSPGSGQGLLNTQRLLESSRDTRQQMGEYFAQRPGQMERAARPEFDNIAPAPRDPSMIGPQVGAAAERTVNDVRGAINRTTRPMYQHAEAQRIDPHVFQMIEADPVFQEGLRRVRNDPWIGPQVEHLPDDSVAVIDAIKKQLDETATNLRSPTAGTARNSYAASIIDSGNENMVSAADLATGSRRGAGVMGSYETARTQQAQLRQQYLEPVLNGPLGRLAERDMTTQRAIEATFPANPLPNSQDEIATAMRALAQRSQTAARQLVRAHAESTFNQAAKDLVGGANQNSGGKFAASLVGNPQQRANLQAAVEALPQGQQVWQGFERFIQIAQATGRRQGIGSRTTFNTADLKDMGGGKAVTEVGKAAASVQRLMTGLGDAWDRWQLGSNLGQLAQILTDPRSGQLLRAIAQRPTGSREAEIMAARLAAIFTTAANSADQRKRAAD